MAKRIKEEFKVVSPETAKLAHELGFDIVTKKRYLGDKCRKVDMNLDLVEGEYFAPAQVTLDSWLRDRGYHIRIQPTYWGEVNENTGMYGSLVIEFNMLLFDMNDVDHVGTSVNDFEDVGYKIHWIQEEEEDEDGDIFSDDKLFKTYEECLEESLKKALTLLLKKNGI